MPTFFIGIRAPITCYDHLIKDPFKPIPVEERHLTLAYLGSLKKPKQQVYTKLQQLLARHEPQPFTLFFKQLQPYPSWKRIRYIAAIPQPCKQLQNLHQLLQYNFQDLLQDKWHTFSPHISIASTREKTTPSLQALVEKICKGASKDTCILNVRDIAFYMASRGRYVVLRKFYLIQ